MLEDARFHVFFYPDLLAKTSQSVRVFSGVNIARITSYLHSYTEGSQSWINTEIARVGHSY